MTTVTRTDSQPFLKMTTTQIKLTVPKERENCQAWLKAQPPQIVADCLDICQAAFNALQREIGEGEAARLASEISSLRSAAEARLREQAELWQRRLDQQQEAAKEAAARLHSEREHMRQEIKNRNDACVVREQQLEEAYSKALQHEKARRLESEQTASAEAQRWREEVKEQRDAFLEREKNADVAAQENREALRKQLLREHDELVEQRCAGLRSLLAEQEAKTSRVLKELESHDERSKAMHAELKEHHAEEKELLKSQFAQQLESLIKDHQQQLQLKTQKLEEQVAINSIVSGDLQTKQKEAQELLERLQTETRRLYEEKAAEASKLSAEKEKILAQYQDFLRHSSSSGGCDSAAQLGKIGEDFVSQIHAAMNLGEWEDTSRRPEEGCADALWTLDFSGSRKMRALVEVKNVASIHRQKDLDKFECDCAQAVRTGSINAAILVSLRARVHGKKQIDLSLRQGIPVIYMSRAADDALPAETLVKLGFSAMASAWPLLQSNRGEQGDAALQSASMFLDEQLVKAQRLSKSIDDLEKQCRSLGRVSSDLKKTRDGMIKDVDCLRTQFPQLQPEWAEEEEQVVDPWASPEAKELIRLVISWKDEHGGRYPKELADLGALPETLRSFCIGISSATTFRAEVLTRAKACVPKGPPRGQKRSRVGGEAAAASAEQDEE